MKWSMLVLWATLAFPAAADPSFWLRNTDPEASFLWWPVADAGPWTADAVLPGLVAVGPRTVAPGERVLVSVSTGQAVVGAFVPWSRIPGYLTPVTGGVILASEFPSRGTLLVDSPRFSAANRGRALTAPLQAWGLVPATLVLGQVEGWDGIPEALTWGTGFVPGQPWPKTLPRPTALKLDQRDGALWVSLQADRPWPSSGGGMSLVLRRPGAFVEVPLVGDPTVWLWKDGEAAAGAGRAVRVGAQVQAWIPWDRMSEAERQVWQRARCTVEVLVSRGDTVQSYPWGSVSLGELP